LDVIIQDGHSVTVAYIDFNKAGLLRHSGWR